jgi:glycosyltransferase involved in cell wall biosynthesis
MVTHSSYESDNRIVRYARALVEQGDEVHVLSLRRRPDQPVFESCDGVQVHRIQDRFGKHGGSAWSFLWPLVRFLLVATWWFVKTGGRRFDVVHVHNIPDFLVIAAIPAKLRGARVVLDIHDIVPEFFASKFGAAPGSAVFRALLLMERLSAAMADHVILANHLWLDKYAKRCHVAQKCSVMVNHVDERLFRPLPRSRTSTEPRVVFPGGLQWHQGLDIAIRAFALLAPRMPAARFDIYGDGNMKAQLLALVAELGMQQHVRFHEPVTLQDVARIMADADLGVVPKRADSFGNEAYSTKIMEFMAVGVPVVVSDTRVDRHYFDDSVVRFFPSGDAAALAEAMHGLLCDAPSRESMVARARLYVDRHGWSHHKADYLRLIDGLGTVPVTHADSAATR